MSEFNPDAFIAQAEAPQTQQTPPQEGQSQSFDPDSFIQQVQEEKYGTPEQLLKTVAEGAAKGAFGAAAPYIEKKLGVNPQNILNRQEANPILSGASEIGGFGAGAIADFGLPSVLGKAGELATHAAGLGEAATTSSKLAAGAAKAATEMGLYQANDEATKAILDAPNTTGQIAANIGLAAVLGGATGPMLTGGGILAKTALDNTFLKDFVDRLAFRKANPDPTEMINHELSNAYDMYHQMGSEVGGASGLKAQALKKLMPDMSENLIAHTQDLTLKVENGLKELVETGDPHAKLLERELNKYRMAVNSPDITSYQMFDATQNLKQQLQEWGKFNKNLVPLSEKNFRNIAKNLSYKVRTSLENPKIWGSGVAGLQKDLNAAWTKTIPAIKDIESKFMTKISGEPVIDPAKLNTYLNQNGKATDTTIRQQMMGKFLEGMKAFSKATQSAYEKAGVDNPFGPMSFQALEESLQKRSTGSKLADVWYNKLESHSLGSAAGIAAGEVISPGFGGAYLGKEVLGPVFSSMIKPLLDKYPNIDTQAFHQVLNMAKNIQDGNNKLVNAVGSIFKGAVRVVPANAMPNDKDLEKLDKRAQAMNEHPEFLANTSGKVGNYSQDHAIAIGKGTSDAVNYLNSQRPNLTKAAPLDPTPKVSAMQESAFKRTLTIAQQPLTVLQHVKDGSITPKDIKDLASMYPEYTAKMQQQVMQSMIDHIQDGDTVPYHTKLGVSLFLATPMDSSMLPQSIIAAQPKPQQSPAPQGQSPKQAKNTAKLGGKTNDSYKTADQAAESDRTSRA